MEVTSHGLDQKRVACIDFDVAIFTNLTPEHLDYHKTMENYGKAKNILFKNIGESQSKKKFLKAAIINSDDPYAPLVVEGCSAPIITYGIEKQADLQAFDVQFTQSGTTFNLKYKDQITNV